MSIAHQALIPCDFTEVAFGDAVATLRADPSEVHVFCSQRSWEEARAVAKKYGCQISYVPDEILKEIYHWAVVHGSNIYWSEGV